MRRGTYTALAATLLALTLLGCAPVPTEPEEATSSAGFPQIDAEPTRPALTDFSYLTGAWTVTATLTEIDKGIMREAADQPAQSWACMVEGSTMTLVTGARTYVGTIMPELDEGWVYTARAHYRDEDGTAWTSAIEVHGKPTGDATFSGEMEGAIDSDLGGRLYRARWDIEGRRQR